MTHPDQIAALLSEGRHAEAAELARTSGDPAHAAKIYERIWEFRTAAACALEAGDKIAALKNLIDARALDEAFALGAEIGATSDEGARAAADVYEGRRIYDQAGALRERLGDLERAATIYQRGGHLYEAAGALEKAGKPRDAGRLLERLLAESDGPVTTGRAHLGLGRLLGRLGHHEEAAAHLQDAAESEEQGTAADARRLLVVELTAMGLRDAAEDALAAAREHFPALPAALDAALQQITTGAATPSDAGPAIVGGRYRLLRLLGQGGSGRVYLARDEVSGAEVAVKLFHAAHARGHEQYERFVREARIWGKGHHPNIVDVLDFREDLGFFVMEHLPGGTLADRLTPRLAPLHVRRLAVDVLAGLAHAHARGVVHRDVKPQNLFFDGHGGAKIGDFGVAHLLDLGQTQTGALIGTLAYMSPEQVTGAHLSAAADLYSLGVTMFQALTGRLPFLGPDFVAQHLGEAPPKPSEVYAELGTAWDELVLLLLTKDPDARPSAALEVRDAVAKIDLGAKRSVMVLGRGPGAAEEPAAASTPAAKAAGRARYEGETAIGQTSISSLARAVDTALERSVILERFAAAPDPRTEARFLRLAAASTPYLQRVLSWDRAERMLVLEAPVGETLAARLLTGPLAPRAVARLIGELAAALVAAGVHGAIAAERVLLDDDGCVTLLCAGLGAATEPEATMADDVAATLSLAARAAGGTDLQAALGPRLLAGAAAGLVTPATAVEMATFADALDRALAAAERIAEHVRAMATKATSVPARARVRSQAMKHGLAQARIEEILG